MTQDAVHGDALERSGLAPSGDLQETPYAILLVAMALAQKSAVLELRRHQLEKQIVFEDGAPVDCHSNIATEMLGRTLVASGKIREADCQSAIAESASRNIPLGEILVERKLISSTELYRALQQNLGRKLLEPFSWKSGTYSISYDVPPIDSPLRVNVAQLLLTGIGKIDVQEAADEGAAAAFGRYLSLTAEPLFSLDQVRLTSDQQKVVEAARAGRKFDDLVTSSGIDVDDLNRIVYALMLLGVVTATDQPVTEAEAPSTDTLENPYIDNPFAVGEGDQPGTLATVELPAAPIPETREYPQAKTIPASPKIEVATDEEVMSAYLAYRRKDPFELLGVAESDPAETIAKAYEALSDRFDPANFDPSTPDGIRDKARDVFLAINRAHTDLTDPEARVALEARRAKQRQAAAAAAAAEATQPSRPVSQSPQPPGPKLLDPEAFCRNGRELAAAGKLREALSSFEMAAECDAQNGTYAAEAAWCRFQLQVSPPANAIKMLKNAIRIDPKCGIAHLYAGHVESILGHRSEAAAHFNRAATLMPRDPRPKAALEGLR